MFVIGITGGIGTGKSTVASLCRGAGIPVLDADKISHSVTQRNVIAIAEIKDKFGEDYINADNSLNRKKIADLVFSDKRALDELSFIIHRHTLDQIGTYLKELKKYLNSNDITYTSYFIQASAQERLILRLNLSCAEAWIK